LSRWRVESIRGLDSALLPFRLRVCCAQASSRFAVVRSIDLWLIPIGLRGSHDSKAGTASSPCPNTCLILRVAHDSHSPLLAYSLYFCSACWSCSAGRAGRWTLPHRLMVCVFGPGRAAAFSILLQSVGSSYIGCGAGAAFYSTGETIAPSRTFKTLLERPKRYYFMAGLSFLQLDWQLGLLAFVSFRHWPWHWLPLCYATRSLTAMPRVIAPEVDGFHWNRYWPTDIRLTSGRGKGQGSFDCRPHWEFCHQ